MPEHRIPTVGARVRDLQEPGRKMSTTGGTEQGTVYVLDEPDVIRKKFKRAVTDSGAEVAARRGQAGITNMIEILATVRGVAPEAVERDFEGLRYGDFKTAVGDEVADWLAPVRERYARAARRRGGARGRPRGRGREGPRDRLGDGRRRPRRDGRRPCPRRLIRRASF